MKNALIALSLALGAFISPIVAPAQSTEIIKVAESAWLSLAEPEHARSPNVIW